MARSEASSSLTSPSASSTPSGGARRGPALLDAPCGSAIATCPMAKAAMNSTAAPNVKPFLRAVGRRSFYSISGRANGNCRLAWRSHEMSSAPTKSRGGGDPVTAGRLTLGGARRSKSP